MKKNLKIIFLLLAVVGILVIALLLIFCNVSLADVSLDTFIGVMVTLRRERMYEFLEKLVRVALPRIRDFKGIESKFDGRGNYTLGIQEQIIFPEINIDSITRILGMNITFVTSAQTDEEGYALLKEFGLPFKNAKKD